MVAEHRGDFPPAVDLAQQRGVRQGEENWSCWTRQRSRLGAVAVATSNVAPLVRSRPEYGPTLVLELSMTLWPLSRRRSWSGPSKYEVRRQFRAPPRGGRRSQATISTRTMAMAPAAIAVPKTSSVPTSMFLEDLSFVNGSVWRSGWRADRARRRQQQARSWESPVTCCRWCRRRRTWRLPGAICGR